MSIRLASVAPRGGAWIETTACQVCSKSLSVAPRGGAWIETLFMVNVKKAGSVAPRGGAWIETRISQDIADGIDASHPVGVRGLKQVQGFQFTGAVGRTPWGCVD